MVTGIDGAINQAKDGLTAVRSLRIRIEDWITSYAPDSTVRRNIVISIWDGLWNAAAVGLTQSFTGVFALALGASDTMIGWLTALPALITMLSHVPAALIVERHPHRLRVAIPSALLARSSYLMYALIPFLPLAPAYRAWIFILLFAVMTFPGTACGTAWTAMMGDIFPSRLRGRVFGDRNMILGLATMICTALAGPFLDWLPYPWNYVVIFVAAFVAQMLSTWYLSRMIENPQPVAERRPGGSWHGVRSALRDSGFLYFTLTLFVVHVGFNISAAMWPILNVRVLGLSKTFIGSVSVTSQLVMVLTSRWWGRFADRHGNRLALFLSIAIFAPQPWLHNFVRTGWPLLPLAVLNGIASAGFGMVLFNALLDISPDERNRPSYIAVFHTVMGVTGFVAPMIGVWIHQATDMGWVFNAATWLRLAGMAMMVWKVGLKEPQSQRSRARVDTA